MVLQWYADVQELCGGMDLRKGCGDQVMFMSAKEIQKYIVHISNDLKVSDVRSQSLWLNSSRMD